MKMKLTPKQAYYLRHINKHGEIPVSRIERSLNSPKAINDAVMFAHFCINYGIHPSDAAELMTLLRKYVSAAVNESNVGGEKLAKKANSLRTRFETCATTLGFTEIQWPDFFPNAKHHNITSSQTDDIHCWPTCRAGD